MAFAPRTCISTRDPSPRRRLPFRSALGLCPDGGAVEAYLNVSRALDTIRSCELKVAGNFTYGVMALSAATYTFWCIFGSQLVPAAIQHGSALAQCLWHCNFLAVFWYDTRKICFNTLALSILL
ncbi:unnamed protein product [Urochloa humidicola]